ncbi:MAG: hypothetical protein A3F21_03485 [Candidatus Portnoybacteria bacterium RIFCSPLOWO2_01_FULL_38_39]|uniref:Carbonic anhydrase n=1 Tax=Candidatus Portnoybacteria bacterium RIFCSPLOWO2_01_FULL_43_11 TaxID=1802000 RepID=A0A1G2FMJ4_9BACT|nr:MAG: hypothetical protein A3F21_03485 [Candidatus Portnoybacteria bacterium RIFCSPLOWO2_01_FULL_38_39]OGZ38840.1 MAG: hypothetical protein A3A94_02285 [Candidatus Portnoybacteria bacterium RIFCSPLOWO2_01_FULL_43_11]
MNNHSHKLPQAIVLSCIDFRFHEKLKRALKKEKINSYDLICLAGGAKNLVSPNKKIYQQIVIDNIKLAQKLHKIKTVVLCNHIDCGAYLPADLSAKASASAEVLAQTGGGSSQFKNQNEETKFHQAELKKAGNLLKKLFPALRIKVILLE